MDEGRQRVGRKSGLSGAGGTKMKSWLQQFSASTCPRIVASGAGSSAPAIEVRKDVEYAVHGGQSLQGTLYSPAAPGAHPAVIAIHGGAWKQGDRDR